ncbi:hypothetical protein EsH8_I_001352 [Colletotrichum jinshuiense]
MQASPRAMHSKSRGGCLRCKAKKTKCDERKPSCARCEERGIQCPGYALNVRWSRKHQVRADGAAAAKEAGQSPSRQQRSSSSRASPQRNPCADAGAATAAEMHQFPADGPQFDSWLGFPGQWDFSMPPALPDFDVITCALPVSAAAPPWEASFVGSAWTVESPSAASSSNADEQAKGHRLPTWDDENARATGSAEDAEQAHHHLTQAAQNGLCALAPAQPRQAEMFGEAPRQISHLPTALSEYFFREVITLYCAWDSKSNVMRNIVETMWQSSGALYHTIQSMAAACLSEDFPHLLPVARSEHSRALELIHGRPPPSTHKRAMLLASTLLGHTSSWLSPQNLATDVFRASCSMLEDIAAETGRDESLSFFSDTMDYWAMLLAYLTDSRDLGDYRRGVSVGPADPTKSIEPHPYSGISHDTVRILTDTGVLIFQYRKHMSAVKFLTENDLDVFRAALREARRLERVLLAHRPPDPSRVRDPGDPKTPLRHLELIDEAYRRTGLLQLYRVFPDLLSERYAPWDREALLRPLPAERPPTPRERQAWLTKLAMNILGTLREIPFESRTRSAQPFIMVAISSELRRDAQHLRAAPAAGPAAVAIDPASIEIVRARKFVRSRLEAYTHILPLRKSRVISELIDHTWAALDAGKEDVYWLDVAYEKNLGTMMG